MIEVLKESTLFIKINSVDWVIDSIILKVVSSECGEVHTDPNYWLTLIISDPNYFVC